MAYQTGHFYQYNSPVCVSGTYWFPDGTNTIRNEITQWYMNYYGRYGETSGVEGHRSTWLASNTDPALRTPVSTIVYDGGIQSGEQQAVNARGRHYGMALGGCPPPPQITSFYASPNPQTSGISGVPNSTTQFYWSSTGTSSAFIDQGVGSVTTSGSRTIDTGLQSVAGSNSPATRTYTLTVIGLNGFSTDTADITVYVYNDNTPDNFSLPNQNNVNPNTATTVSSTISGIDMATSVNGGPGVQVSTNNSSFSSNTTITNNQTVYARVTSLGFNQDPSGLTNSKEFYVDVGTLRRFFTVTTRAPDVNETFNLPDEVDRVPYPDIDTIDEPVEQFIVSNPLNIDDIELVNPSGVEIRTNNSNVQVRIKRQGASSFSGWTDVKQI
jgi:hypothetical protein